MRREHLFLLRMWSDGDEELAWRASVKDLRTGESLNFNSLAALRAFLGHQRPDETLAVKVEKNR